MPGVTIKSKREIELMRDAGKLLRDVHLRLGEEIAPGISTLDLDRLGEELIRKTDSIPSFLNYEGYPASVCVSINDEVVHGIPKKDRIIKDGDIVSLDIGLIHKGYQSDASGHFSYNYSMSEITDQDWDVISSRGLNKLENMLLLKGADGCYYASYLTADNVIGDHMFSDCENLTNIILPKNASKIGGYAFHNCTALKTVINRPANVSKTAFQNSGVK